MNDALVLSLLNLGAGGVIAAFIVATLNKKVDTLIDEVRKLADAIGRTLPR